MASKQVIILFRRLRSNYLLISVGNSEKPQQQFLDYVELGLEVNTGPLLGLLDTDPSSVTLGWNFLKSLAEKRCFYGNNKVKAFFDVRKAMFLSSELCVSLPLLNALSLHLQATLGSNRCLLLGNGDVLSSISADEDENHFCRSIAINDLNFLLKQISRAETNKTEELFQVWLRSTKSIVPYLVDVMISNIGDGFKIVCLFEAKYNTLIRTVTVFLVQLDRIQYSNDVMKETQEMEKTVESIAQQLLAFSSSNPSRWSAGGGFMKNPERTAYFIESLWQRTADLLLASSGCYTFDPERPRSSTNISLGSLRSAISSASLNSSIVSHPVARKFRPSLKCDVTMEYFRRQAVNILQELCFESHRLTAPQKLAQFRKVVARVIDPREGSIWSDMQLAMSSEEKSADLSSFMCPVSLGLDMVAYSVTVPTKSVSVTFTPEWVKDEFDSPTKFPSPTGSVNLIGKSGKHYHLLKIRAQLKHPATWMSMFRNVRTYVNGANSNERSEYAYAVALFEEGINYELAEREVLKLIELVTLKMYSICSFIY
ncbi:hypothetical protein ANCCAN_02856 [Ancylostoma caninum]|uniref:Uncharacterized protein n=1 Tax=Ancylostoma caninum TaxID=29170 RepID=A0A368H602_ANCCA|nr:hypothetical protein ANCCAN_02856 [Ancylostoma caninum]